MEARGRNVDAQFWVADAFSTGLNDVVYAIVTCLDVLLYLPDKLAVLKEVHRILELEGLFTFNGWERHRYSQRFGA